MNADSHPIVRIAEKRDILDYISWDVEQTVDPVWSDGTYDRSFVAKIVGYINNKPRGKIVLRDGRIVHFSSISQCVDGSFIINKPYRIE